MRKGARRGLKAQLATNNTVNRRQLMGQALQDMYDPAFKHGEHVALELTC